MPTLDGVADEAVIDAEPGPLRTTVKLAGVEIHFQANSSKTAEAIAKGVVEFCLPHFVQKKAPRMTLIDSDDKPYDLNAMFTEMQFYQKIDSFKIGDHKFQLTHLMGPCQYGPRSPSTSLREWLDGYGRIHRRPNA